MSSKTARLHRRQAANRKKYARLRRAGRLPLHTRAERQHAADERQRKHESERRREARHRRARFAVATTVGAAALTFTAASTAGGVTYSDASQVSVQLWSINSDHPDYPHIPEQSLTEYPVFYAAGTATTGPRTQRSAKPWDGWEWTRG